MSVFAWGRIKNKHVFQHSEHSLQFTIWHLADALNPDRLTMADNTSII